MTDLYCKARKIGSGWYGVFRTPGRHERYVECEGERQRFDTEAQALQAAADTLCTIFGDRTTGFSAGPLSDARKAAEALFKNG